MIKSKAIKLLLINQQTTEETTFDEESAFCIQLFCIDEKYEMRSVRKHVILLPKFAIQNFSTIQRKYLFFVVCCRCGDLFSSVFLTELWGFLFRSIDFLPAVFQLFPVSTKYNWNSNTVILELGTGTSEL